MKKKLPGTRDDVSQAPVVYLSWLPLRVMVVVGHIEVVVDTCDGVGRCVEVTVMFDASR